MSFPRNIMTHRATIQRETDTEDDRGFRTRAWADHLVSVPCHWFQVESRRTRDSREIENYRLIAAEHYYSLIVPLNQDIVERDRITNLVDQRGQRVFANILQIEGKKRYLFYDSLLVRELVGDA